MRTYEVIFKNLGRVVSRQFIGARNETAAASRAAERVRADLFYDEVEATAVGG